MSQKPNDTCTDTSFEVRLPEFVSGFLSEEERREIRAHLDSCRSCTLSVLIMRGVAQAGREAAQVTEESPSTTGHSAHLTEQQVVAMYASPDSLSEQERLLLERHFASCPLCLREIDFLRSMESDMREARLSTDQKKGLSRSEKREWLGMPRSVFAVAAVVLICAVVGSLWYINREDEPWVTVTHLREMQRNGSQLPVVSRELDRPLVKVIVPLPRQSDQLQYVVILNNSIRDRANAVITVHTDTSQSLSYIIDTRNLSDGEYDLQVMESEAVDMTPVEFHFPFILATSR